jgi:hypothetical protein
MPDVFRRPLLLASMFLSFSILHSSTI